VEFWSSSRDRPEEILRDTPRAPHATPGPRPNLFRCRTTRSAAAR
jgi:hypothetical protein